VTEFGIADLGAIVLSYFCLAFALALVALFARILRPFSAIVINSAKVRSGDLSLALLVLLNFLRSRCISSAQFVKLVFAHQLLP
jgi:hypothetical protein